MDIQDYEEYLFSEGLITDDMSERIVASLPKGLSDVTMRGSRESLRSSKESLHGSQESLGFSSMSCESLTSSSSAHQDFKPNNLQSSKLFGKPLRFFKKAVSFLTENSNAQSSNLLGTASSAAEIGMENLECYVKRSERKFFTILFDRVLFIQLYIRKYRIIVLYLINLCKKLKILIFIWTLMCPFVFNVSKI